MAGKFSRNNKPYLSAFGDDIFFIFCQRTPGISSGGITLTSGQKLAEIVRASKKMAVDQKSANMEKRELGNEAVWSLSSAKPGNGLY